MSSDPAADYRRLVLDFTSALAAREYARAYGMASKDYQQRVTVENMRGEFEGIVPPDWGMIEAVELGQTMDDWPGKQAADVAWAYVSIGGDVYSEAVVVIVMLEDGAMKVRDVQFGRP